MNRIAIIALAFWCLQIDAAPVPKESKSDGGIAGTWALNSVNVDNADARVGTGCFWTIGERGELDVHLGAAPPKNPEPYVQLILDAKLKTVEYKYINGKAESYPGLYEVDGDTLRVCCNIKSGRRPAKIAPGVDMQIWTLHRGKAGVDK